MSNLFSAGLYRLRKSKVFWLALIFMAVISVILCVEMARNAVTDPNITFADGMFSNQAVMNLVMAVFVTLFLGTEYSDRTIRNKIISGHSRSTIYLAAFLVSSVGGLIIYAVSLGISAGLGSLLLHAAETPSVGKIFSQALIGALVCLVDAAFFTFFVMVLGNKTAGAVTGLVAGCGCLQPSFRRRIYLRAEERLQGDAEFSWGKHRGKCGFLSQRRHGMGKASQSALSFRKVTAGL